MWTLAQILAELQFSAEILTELRKHTVALQKLEMELDTANTSLSQIVKLLTPATIAGVQIVFGQPQHN